MSMLHFRGHGCRKGWGGALGLGWRKQLPLKAMIGRETTQPLARRPEMSSLRGICSRVETRSHREMPFFRTVRA